MKKEKKQKKNNCKISTIPIMIHSMVYWNVYMHWHSIGLHIIFILFELLSIWSVAWWCRMTTKMLYIDMGTPVLNQLNWLARDRYAFMFSAFDLYKSIYSHNTPGFMCIRLTLFMEPMRNRCVICFQHLFIRCWYAMNRVKWHKILVT